MPYRKKLDKKECESCGNLFQPKTSKQIFCSKKCSTNNNIKKKDKMIGTRTRKLRGGEHIMNDYCDICYIGIGTSNIREIVNDKEHIEIFHHLEDKYYNYKWSNGILHLCKTCYDELKLMKRPTKYIRSQINGIKKEQDI